MAKLLSIYDRLREVYRRSGAGNYRAFAAELEVTPSAISKLMNRQTAPTLDTLVRMSGRYGWSVHWLATGQGPEMAIAEPDLAAFEAGKREGAAVAIRDIAGILGSMAQSTSAGAEWGALMDLIEGPRKAAPVADRKQGGDGGGKRSA